MIICTYIPTAGKDEAKNETKLNDAIRQVFQFLAERNNSGDPKARKIRTVAMPLLGTGRYGHAAKTAARAFLCEILRQLPNSGIKRVQFMDQRVEPLEALKWELQQHDAGCTTSDLPITKVIVPGW